MPTLPNLTTMRFGKSASSADAQAIAPSGRTFTRSAGTLLLVGFFALLGIVGTTIWLAERTQTYFNEVVEARSARVVTADLRFFLQQAETSQRGYLLTLDPSYLTQYEEARSKVMPLFEQLRAVLAPYPQADEAVAMADQALNAKLAEMAETIRLIDAGKREEALALVATDGGKDAMDEAQAMFAGILVAADERLTTGVADQRGSAQALRWVTLAASIIILFVAGGSVVTVLRYTRQLADARAEVERLNTGLEERVRERTGELLRANEEIQRFAYIVTHDLRAPLVNIMGFTSELEGSLVPLRAYLEAEPEARTPEAMDEARAALADLPEAIGFIRSSTKKMDGLINAILKLSREGRRVLKPEPIDLRSLALTLTETVQHQIEATGGEIRVDAGKEHLVSDRLALDQILGNLLDNAVKYRHPERPPLITVEAEPAPRQRVVLRVSDNGRGIAPQDHDRVFELFRRSGAQDQAGEGIGLAHVRAMVRNLGGEITLRSVLGQGTVFEISLPRDLQAFLGVSKP